MLNIHYFASIREALDIGQEELELPAQVGNVGELIDYLCVTRGEPWCSGLDESSVLIAVNQHVVKRDAPIHDGDEVAFFPPVTGG